MVQFIQRGPSFAEQLGQSVGGAASNFVNQLSQMQMQLALEKQKQAQRLKTIQGIKSGSTSAFGSEFQPKDFYQEAEAFALADEPQLSRISLEKGKQERKESFAKEQALEPKLLELQDQLAKTEETGLRFDRLGELTSPQFEDKFPPSLMTALFTKNGELSPVAASQLSPEAQEFTKLVIDEIQGAQKTYGGKVSNFEAAQYLKKLPSLINTPEGRQRVLRDLRIMNKLSQNHDQGVLDIMERYNNKISLSKANSIYRKEHAKDEANMKKAFIHPNEFPFTELNEFNASIYPGVTIEDPETGQKFTSNGQNWELK